MSVLLVGCTSLTASSPEATAKGTNRAAPAQQPIFKDVTAIAGISFAHSNGATGKWYYVEETGAGCTFFDYNQDGFLDIFLVQSGTIPRAKDDTNPANFCALYRNQGDGTFMNVTAGSGLDKNLNYGQGVTVGDYDNDGYNDLYITAYGGNHLFRNEQGSGKFTDVTEQANVGDTDQGLRYATSAGFGDYDNDGDLDLFVCHYAPWSPEKNIVCKTATGADDYCTPDVLDTDANRLYRNNGDGTFTDVSRQTGIGKIKGHGLGVAWFDYNQDGHEDIFVASDLTMQFLWHNNGDGTFTNVSEQAGTAYDYNAGHLAGMGIGIGDFDNSGKESLFVTNFTNQPNTLWKNLGGGLFDDVSLMANLALPHMKYLAFGCDFLDYDADGWKDLVMANGHVVVGIAETADGITYKQRKQLFRNTGNGRFVEITENLGDLGTPTVSRGLATGDFNNDGRVDFLVNNQNAAPQLFQNQLPLDHHWVSLKLIGTKSNRNGYHAKVTVTCGKQKYYSEVKSSTSFASHSDARLYFGLGKATLVDKVEIRWPSGIRDTLTHLAVDSFYTVTEGTGKAVPLAK